jgi:hypothetical protein
MVCLTLIVHSERQPARAEATQAQDAQQSDTSNDKTAVEKHYDPLAGHQHLRGGIWDNANALGKVNPENKDYGERISEWKRTVISGTIRNVVFWTPL